AVNPAFTGTKAAALYRREIPAGSAATIRLRLTDKDPRGASADLFGEPFDEVFARRIEEADEFYSQAVPCNCSPEEMRTQRQAFPGLLWSKQSYHYDIKEWLEGDPTQPAPPPERKHGRNHEWTNLYNADVHLMPDKWEFPWYASWDMAFHCVALAPIDATFA